MHDVVLLHRCYPSTPHGVGPWLPAPVGTHPTLETTMSTLLTLTQAPLGSRVFPCSTCAGSGDIDPLTAGCPDCWGMGVLIAYPPQPDALCFTSSIRTFGTFVTYLTAEAEDAFFAFRPFPYVTFHPLPFDPTYPVPVDPAPF